MSLRSTGLKYHERGVHVSKISVVKRCRKLEAMVRGNCAWFLGVAVRREGSWKGTRNPRCITSVPRPVMMAKDRKSKTTQLSRLHDKLSASLRNYRGGADELFRFTDPEVRAKAVESVKKLDLHEATLLLDRIIYLTLTRIVHVKNDAARCSGKVIYSIQGAQAQVNRIWNKGRGNMRIYECPYCLGHHLTHTAHRDSDRQVA